MPFTNTTPLKKYPFVRLLAFLILGILFQQYVQFSFAVLLTFFFVTCLFFVAFIFAGQAFKFAFLWLQGLGILLVFALVGAALVYFKEVSHNPYWAGAKYRAGQTVLLTIEEPLVEKPSAWKALASITAIQQGNGWEKLDGKAILYFYKGRKQPPIIYGTQILLKSPLQPIKNSGNPGAFDYKTYCLLQGIAYQVFIYPGQYIPLAGNQGNFFGRMIYKARDAALAVLKKNIPGEKEQGVAEALLVGYRADLDADIVQAYTNTGVIHIIAISGLHQAMIYALVVGIWGLFPQKKVTRIAKPISILLVLWVFALLAGAMPSICRATIMFSFIVLGQAIGKRSNTYNNLAASAFLLLVYNPYYLWDAGFVLSYSAVLSIVLFYKPVYNWFYIKNKLLDKLWASTAITLSVQILTLPVVLFYFHQFSNFFLLANFVAVPLSCAILYGEMALLLVAFITPLANWVGNIVGLVITGLNLVIEYLNRLPLAVWGNIYVDVPQTLLLYACIISAAVWLSNRWPKALVLSLLFLSALVLYSGMELINAKKVQKMIVYNVPKQTAIDILQGGSYRFFGDSVFLQEGPLLRYNVKPCRTLYRVSAAKNPAFGYAIKNTCIIVNHTKILVLDNTFVIPVTTAKIPVDVIILCKKPKYTMAQINRVFSFKQLVFDSSNPMVKIRAWKKDCDSLHLRFYSVPEQGAFELNL